MNQPPLGEALRLLRSYHDISQTKLAAELGISRSYLCEIESGKKQPSLDLLKMYASEFSMPLSAILMFSESVEGGPLSERARRASVGAALKLLNWVDSRKNAGKAVA